MLTSFRRCRVITRAQVPGAFVFEGGRFIWPGVRVGFGRHVTLEDGAAATMHTLSLRPLVFSIENFLSDEECAYIRLHAEPFMAQSGVSLMDKDRGKAATEWRTSATHFMPSPKHPVLQAIDRRVASLTRTPLSHQEYVQVLRYQETQK